MPRTGRPTSRPPREELEDLYAYDRQNKRIVEIAAHYHVSRDTAKDWLSHYGITKRPMPDKVAGRVRPPCDPKRVSWLNEYEEAPPMRPDVAVVAGPAIVVDKPRPKRARRADPLATPATPEQLAAARAMLAATKARHDQSIYARAKATVASLIAYKQRWCL